MTYFAICDAQNSRFQYNVATFKLPKHVNYCLKFNLNLSVPQKNVPDWN